MEKNRNLATEAERIQKRYNIENEMIRLAALGDAQTLHQVLQENRNTFRFPERGKDELRVDKNLAIVFNTLLRKAIEFGGVHPLHIHRISSRFAVIIEKAQSIEELDKIQDRMIDEYCELSRIGSGQGYSPAVAHSVEFIKKTYREKLNLTTLAQVVGVSKSYLCRLFKKETGKTIIEFLNRYRVEEAKRYLASGETDIADIALKAGFEDANYFSRVFKDLTGIAPSRYRSHYLQS